MLEKVCEGSAIKHVVKCLIFMALSLKRPSSKLHTSIRKYLNDLNFNILNMFLYYLYTCLQTDIFQTRVTPKWPVQKSTLSDGLLKVRHNIAQAHRIQHAVHVRKAYPLSAFKYNIRASTWHEAVYKHDGVVFKTSKPSFVFFFLSKTKGKKRDRGLLKQAGYRRNLQFCFGDQLESEQNGDRCLETAVQKFWRRIYFLKIN
jgi:hypothetical protein